MARGCHGTSSSLPPFSSCCCSLRRHALLLAACMSLLACCDGHADEITSLPGWSGGPLPARMFGGFVNIDSAMSEEEKGPAAAVAGKKQGAQQHIYYCLVEAEKDPASAPLLVWLEYTVQPS